MAVLPSSFSFISNPQTQLLSGSSLKPSERYLMSFSYNEGPVASNFQGKASITTHRRSLAVRAGEDSGRSSAGIFVGGFVLGGLVVGALGCVYAPQLSKVLAGDERKEFMKKLPKFIYDDEKALEKTRKILTEKIATLNSAIDGVSTQLRGKDAASGGGGGASEKSGEVEAAL